MKAPRWDTAPARTLRGAEALFDAVDLDWFEALSGSWCGDPWSAFERLIRAALPSGTGEAWQAEAMLPSNTPTAPRPLSAMAPTASARVAEASAVLPHGAPRVWPALPNIPHAASAEPAGSLASAREIVRPASGRAARAAASTTPIPIAPAVTTRPVVEPASAPDMRLPADAATATSSHATVRDALSMPDTPGAARGARILRLPGASRSPAPGAPDAVSARASLRPVEPPPSVEPVATHRWPTHQDAAFPTRPVEGLPALRSLLQAAVVESRARQAPPPVDPVQPPRVLPPAAPAPLSAAVPALAAAPAFRALPQLDPVAEEMLVDRLADRLEERMREHALRQFGFTGGLT